MFIELLLLSIKQMSHKHFAFTNLKRKKEKESQYKGVLRLLLWAMGTHSMKTCELEASKCSVHLRIASLKVNSAGSSLLG